MSQSKLSDVPGHLIIVGKGPEDAPTNKIKKKDLKEVMGMLEVDQLNHLQNKVLYALNSGLDIFMVGPKGLGKTNAYVIPVLIHLIDQARVRMKEKPGPFIVIGCPSTERATYLESIFRRIVFKENAELSRVLLMDNVKSVDEFALHTADILIMTGPFLTNALNPKSVLDGMGINFGSVKYVIFEEFGMFFPFYSTEAVQLLNYVKRKGNLNFQTIFSGTIWNDETENLVEILTSPTKPENLVVMFGSILQALRYLNMELNVKYCKDEKGKLDQLAEICRSALDTTQVIVVACRNSDQAMKVERFLNVKEGIKAILRVPGKDGVYSNIFGKNSDPLGKIYVVSDEAFNSVTQNATSLVHFDIDSEHEELEKEPLYRKRFACIWNRLREAGIRPSIFVLVTGNEKNFLTLYNFLSEHSVIPLPTALKEIGARRTKEFLDCQPICTGFKWFGLCTKSHCSQRHYFLDADLKTLPIVPSSGEIEFKVMKCISPSLYVGYLQRHFEMDENGERKCVKSFKDKMDRRISVMQRFYSVSDHRTHPRKISVGEVYCIEFDVGATEFSTGKTYLRVKVLFIYKDGLAVELLCLDTGMTTKAPAHILLILPNVWKTWSNLSVQLVLTNLVPSFESSTEYFSEALKGAKELTVGKIWHGKVLLSLGDTVWVNPVVQFAKDPVTGWMEQGCNLKTELVRSKYASVLDHHMHMVLLYDKIRECDPTFPEIIHELNVDAVVGEFHTVGDPINWIEFGVNEMKAEEKLRPIWLKINSFFHPWEMYGTPVARSDEVVELEIELTKEMERHVLPKCKSSTSSTMKLLSFLKCGAAVAIKGGEEVGHRWQRGLILDKGGEEDVSRRFKVFLVDHGMTMFDMLEMEQVLPIPSKFVEQIPFCSMCLKLAHVTPKQGSDSWEHDDIVELTEMLYGNSFVNAIVYGVAQSEVKLCRYYEAFVLQPTRDGNERNKEPQMGMKCIGFKMVEQNVAQYSPDFENMITQFQSCSLENDPAQLSFAQSSASESECSHDEEAKLEEVDELPDKGDLTLETEHDQVGLEDLVGDQEELIQDAVNFNPAMNAFLALNWDEDEEDDELEDMCFRFGRLRSEGEENEALEEMWKPCENSSGEDEEEETTENSEDNNTEPNDEEVPASSLDLQSSPMSTARYNNGPGYADSELGAHGTNAEEEVFFEVMEPEAEDEDEGESESFLKKCATSILKKWR